MDLTPHQLDAIHDGYEQLTKSMGDDEVRVAGKRTPPRGK